jgi:hypothetical protein
MYELLCLHSIQLTELNMDYHTEPQKYTVKRNLEYKLGSRGFLRLMVNSYIAKQNVISLQYIY